MRTHINRLFIVFAVSMETFLVDAVAQTHKNFKSGSCTDHGVHIQFLDGTHQNFPAGKDYQCSDFKVSADGQYAGWKFNGTVNVDSHGELETYADATLYVLVGKQIYAATQNSRFVNDWYFVSGHAEIVAETAFEHGPSTYILYDIEKKKMTETCDQFKLTHCPRLQKLVKAGK